MLVFFTPGGAEELWLELGEEPSEESVGVRWTEQQLQTIAEPMERYNMIRLPGEVHRKD
jgi:hypothetical protein